MLLVQPWELSLLKHVLIYIYFVRALINNFRWQKMHLFFPGVFCTYLCVINVDFDRWRKKCPCKREGYMPQCVKCKHGGSFLYYLLPVPAGPARFLQVEIETLNMCRNHWNSVPTINRPRCCCYSWKRMWNILNAVLNLALGERSLSYTVYRHPW